MFFVKMKTIWLLPILTCLYFVEGQSPCSTTDGKRGECKRILECPPLRAIAAKPSLTANENETLSRSVCDAVGKTLKVCCAVDTNTCFTPEGLVGHCMRISECDHISKRLQSSWVTEEDRAYVNSIRCQHPEDSVCCGPPPSGRCQPSTAPPHPSTRCCGDDGSGGNKITGGQATAIDQYPWLAIIERARYNPIKVLCGGALISSRYVLTAAHCVKNPDEVGNVRLGEYDINNAGRDCVPVAGGFPGDLDCADDPVVIPIERIIPYLNYIHEQRWHDIAMLRLQRLAPYTDFIRPICLATKDASSLASSTRLYAAGWGAEENMRYSNIKLHVELPYISIESCQPVYNVQTRLRTLQERQICAGGERNKDTCNGDSGGPLMYFNTTTLVFEALGLVSFGPNPCGEVNVPAVYTNVFPYLPWIWDNIKP